MTDVAAQSSVLDLGGVVLGYGKKAVVVAIQVSNGVSDHTHAGRERDLRGAKRLLEQRLPQRLVIGGFALIKNPHAYARPLGEDTDFVIHFSRYDADIYRRSVESVATYHPTGDQANLKALPTPDERRLVREILDISRDREIPLHHFFDINRPGFWTDLRSIFPDLTAHKYIDLIRAAREQIMHQYVARELRHSLPDGELLLNYGFRDMRRRGVDVLAVVPSLLEAREMIDCLKIEDHLDVRDGYSAVPFEWKGKVA